MNVKLDFESPLLVGGIKKVSNYIESIDYISGNVVRAALAKHILSNCPYHKRNEVIEIDGVKRKNWVYFRGESQCTNCPFKGLCKKFSNIKISYFYPEGVTIIPATAMRCKMHPEHGFVDILVEQPICKKCSGRDGRVETVTGYVKEGKDYTVTKSFFAKTAIDRYTGTAKDGMLYSVLAVTATHEKANIFEGSIQGLAQKDLEPVKQLRIGKYISTGFGKCSLIVDEKPSPDIDVDMRNMVKRMTKFNRVYKEFNGIRDEYNYFAIKLNADAKLKFDLENIQGYVTTDEYKNIWLNSLGIEDGYEIEKVYAEVFNFRGYDTSKPEEDKREEPIHMVQKGSVIVLKTLNTFENILNYFYTLDGLGNDMINGFGDFDFYFGGVIE